HCCCLHPHKQTDRKHLYTSNVYTSNIHLFMVSAVVMLDQKLYYLLGYFQALLVTGVVLLYICEITRLYLGYIGTIKEKVTETNFLSGTSSLEQCCVFIDAKGILAGQIFDEVTCWKGGIL
uniref:Uncharacterized protein n=1 Tax=Salmo trutta TaxID=8032 RepID=A0A673YR66_SALTR